MKWKQWHDSKGAEGEEPPDWAKELFTLADEWKTLAPGSDRWIEVGKRLVKVNQENMTIIGTIGALPKPVIVGTGLKNVFPDARPTARCISTSATMYPTGPTSGTRGEAPSGGGSRRPTVAGLSRGNDPSR